MSLPARVFRLLAVLMGLALLSPAAWGQTGAIKLVVAVPPGGSADTLARILAEQIDRTQGQSIVVENRPGAGNAIGTEAVARATPDGRTLLIVANPFVIDPHLRPQSLDPLKAFEPICHLVSSPLLFVVNSASPYRTIGDLIDAARAEPGSLTLAAGGHGSASHIGFELFKRAAKVDMQYVPYLGTAPAINALLGEHVTSALTGYTVISEHLKSGTLRALATAARLRSELVPGVPTMAESGYDYEVVFWNGVVAPAKTPKEMVSRLAGWFSAALQAPNVKSKLLLQGLVPVGTCGADFVAYLGQQYEDYGRAIREANIGGK
jgi:tripartite-type tricarboxylate transporter receptor subunit TctC